MSSPRPFASLEEAVRQAASAASIIERLDATLQDAVQDGDYPQWIGLTYESDHLRTRAVAFAAKFRAQVAAEAAEPRGDDLDDEERALEAASKRRFQRLLNEGEDE